MTVPAATISGDQMFTEIRTLGSKVDHLVAKIDTIPIQVADHEQSIRALVSQVTVVRTQLRAAWAAVGMLFGSGVGVAVFQIAQH